MGEVSSEHSEVVPEPGNAAGTDGFRRVARGTAEHTAMRLAVPGRRAVLKAAALLVVLFMVSPLVPGFGREEQELAVRATGATTAFSPPVRVNDNRANNQAVPVATIMAKQVLYVVWQDARSGDEDIYTSVSYDSGSTFAPNKRADDSVVSSKQLRPDAAVSANGTIYLAWQDNRRGTYDWDIFFTKSIDGGATYATNLKVDDSGIKTTLQTIPSIAVTAGGSICVAWSDDRLGASLSRVRYSYSIDGGGTFSPSAEISPSNGTNGQVGVRLAANGNRVFAAFIDNIAGAGHPYLSVSTDGGRSFGPAIRLDDGSTGAYQHSLAIAPMPGGGAVIAWVSTTPGIDGGDIYASIVSSSGTVIVSNVRVDDDSTGEYQRDPSVAADQLGNVYAAWEDDRNSKFAIRFAYLMAGSEQFSASVEVATPKLDELQREPSIVATEPGRVFVFWQYDKSGDGDIYMSSAYFPELFGLSLVKGWNFLSIPTVGFNYTAGTLGLSTGDIVVSWNSTTQTYDRTFVVGVSPPFKDFAIADSTGYWIYATRDERIMLNGSVPTTTQSREIAVPSSGGWVAVGFESLNVGMYASAIPGMHSVPGSVTVVLSYDPVTGTYRSYVVGKPFTDFMLTPGRAYWCWCTTSGTLEYNP